MHTDLWKAWQRVVAGVTGDMERDLAESNVPPSPALHIASCVADAVAMRTSERGGPEGQLMAAFVLGVQLGVVWARRERDVA